MTTTTAARLDACGSRRRIQGLIWTGWTGSQLAAMSGLPEMTISRLALGASVTVTPATHRAVADLYDQAWQGPVHPDEHARRRAIRGGWAPPLAWDDDTIDDPAAWPEGIRNPADDTHGPYYDEEILLGRSITEIARRHQVKPDSVRAWLLRHTGRWAA